MINHKTNYVKVDNDGLAVFHGGLLRKPKTYKWCDIDYIFAIQVPFFVIKIEIYFENGRCIYVTDNFEDWNEFIDRIYDVFPGFSKENFDKAMFCNEVPFLCWMKEGKTLDEMQQPERPMLAGVMIVLFLLLFTVSLGMLFSGIWIGLLLLIVSVCGFGILKYCGLIW